jgi:hypothetical protein
MRVVRPDNLETHGSRDPDSGKVIGRIHQEPPHRVGRAVPRPDAPLDPRRATEEQAAAFPRRFFARMRQDVAYDHGGNQHVGS